MKKHLEMVNAITGVYTLSNSCINFDRWDARVYWVQYRPSSWKSELKLRIIKYGHF